MANIHRPSQSSLSSYTWTMLCIDYLVRRGDLPKMDVQAAGVGLFSHLPPTARAQSDLCCPLDEMFSHPAPDVDLGVATVARNPKVLRAGITQMFGSLKRKREEDGEEALSAIDGADLFFGMMRHLSSGIDFRKHEVVSLRQDAPFYRTDGAWECGKHAPPRCSSRAQRSQMKH
jgi:hypothetical protein